MPRASTKRKAETPVRAPTKAELNEAMVVFDELFPEQKELQGQLNKIKKRMKLPVALMRAHIAAKRLETLETPDGNIMNANRSRKPRISNRWLEDEDQINEEAKEQIRALATKDTVRYTTKRAKRSRQGN